MPAIFISYASLDQAIADRIVRALEMRGLTCWMSSRDIPLGQDYQASIVAAIEAARVVLVLLSRHSSASKEVPKETALASEIGRTMIPVRIDGSELTGALRYQATNAQRLDLSSSLDARIDGLARQLARELDMAELTERRLRQVAVRRRLGNVLVWPVALGLILALGFEAWQLAPRPRWLGDRLARLAAPGAPGVLAAPPPPPQGGATAPQPDDSARVAAFPRQYYTAMSGPAGGLAAAIQQMVADPVQYEGRSLPRRVLMAEMTAYGQRWPQRNFVVKPGSVRAACNGAALCAVQGVVDFTLHNAAGASSSGSDRFDMRVKMAVAARLTSISIQQASQ